ncbi:MAG: TolC family protein [Chromatiales bacterium]|nr:TolC family protein [Chromatiales bacterium]
MVKRLLTAILLTGVALQTHAEPLTMEQILQKVVNHYPSLKIASMQVEKASKESVRVNSQFGWQLNGQSGLSHETSMTAVAVDRLMVGGGAVKKLSSGDILSLTGSLRFDQLKDSTFTVPDPSTNLDFEVNYRRALGKGADNLDYRLAANQAEVGKKMAYAQEKLQYDQIAAQVLGLYLQAVVTHKQIDNVRISIKHSQRLNKFVKGRLGLGISENKDELQVTAQLNGLKAKLKGLQLLWVQQEITLNRLMGLPWENKLDINLTNDANSPKEQLANYISEATQYSPELLIIDSELAIAESTIQAKSNSRKDTLDLVGFVGNRLTTGELPNNTYTTISEPQIGIRLEYKTNLDHSGYDAALSQAYLDRSIALQKRVDAKERIHYQIASLLAEIHESKGAYRAARLSVKSEQAKLDEAEKRYRNGRIEIDRIIQYESQLTASKLSLSLQKVELERRIYQLALLRGSLWKKVARPHYDWSNAPATNSLSSKPQ